MKYTGTLIAVKDIEKSKQFYHDVLGLDVVADFGANDKKKLPELLAYYEKKGCAVLTLQEVVRA